MKKLFAILLLFSSFLMLGATKVDVDETLTAIEGEMRETFGHTCNIQKSEGMFSKLKGVDLWIAACDEDEYGPVIYEFTEKVSEAFPDKELDVSVDFFTDAKCSDLVLGFIRSGDSDGFGTILDYGNTKKAFNYKTFEDFVKDYGSTDLYIRRKDMTDEERKIYDAVSEYSAEHPDASDEELDKYICEKYGITVDKFNEIYFSAVAKMVY